MQTVLFSAAVLVFSAFVKKACKNAAAKRAEKLHSAGTPKAGARKLSPVAGQ